MYGLLILGASVPSSPRGEKRATGTRHKSPPELPQNEKKRGVAKECILKEPNLEDTQAGHPAMEMSIETPTKEGDATSVSMSFSTPSSAVRKLGYKPTIVDTSILSSPLITEMRGHRPREEDDF